MTHTPWADRLPVPEAGEFALFSAGLLGFALLLANVDFVPILDHANLAFHEAGHLLFRVLGESASLYGGTLMQFVFPTATAVHFLRRERLLPAACAALWFCQNLRYTALYLGDAQAQALPLLGGGEHDWALILARWGLLEADAALAAALRTLGWLGMAAVWALLWWLRRRAA